MNILLYVLAWTVAAMGAGAVVLSGNLNETTMAVLGFIFSGLFFAGVVAGLPWWVDKQFSPRS